MEGSGDLYQDGKTYVVAEPLHSNSAKPNSRLYLKMITAYEGCHIEVGIRFTMLKGFVLCLGKSCWRGHALPEFENSQAKIVSGGPLRCHEPLSVRPIANTDLHGKVESGQSRYLGNEGRLLWLVCVPIPNVASPKYDRRISPTSRVKWEGRTSLSSRLLMQLVSNHHLDFWLLERCMPRSKEPISRTTAEH